MTSGHTKLTNKLKKLSGAHPDISDVILFGSAARGKEKPNDIDILVLFKDKVDKNLEYMIRKEAEKEYSNVSVVSKTEKTVMEESFDAREGILFEGKSLITGEPLARKHGFRSFGMFKYRFGNWSSLQKTKFYHALNGRGGKIGIIALLECIKLSDSVVLAPLEKTEQFREFLDSWKITYIYVPTLMPERLGKKKILE